MVFIDIIDCQTVNVGKNMIFAVFSILFLILLLIIFIKIASMFYSLLWYSTSFL